MSPEEAQRRLVAKPPRRIAVLQTAFLGDVVFTSPLVRALKRRFPAARLTLIVAPRGEAIARHMPFVDEVRIFDKGGADATFGGLWRVSRQSPIDLLVTPHPSSRSALFSFVSPAALTVGPRTFPQSLAYDVAVDMGSGPFVERMLTLATALGASATPDVHLTVSDKKLAAARAQLGEGRFAAAIVGSEWATKRLPVESWAKVLDGLVEAGVTPVLHGSPKEKPLEDAIRAASRDASRYRSFMGVSVSEALALIAASSVAVGGDTGLVHAARALGVPTIAFFGPTDPAKHVWEPSSQVLVRGVPCQPCHAHGPMVCPKGHHDCLRTFDLDLLTRVVREKVAV